MGNKADAAPRDFPKQTGNSALGKVVSLNFIFQRHAAELGSQIPVSLNNPLDQAFMSQMVEAFLLTVSLSGSPDDGEIFWTAGIKKNLFQFRCQFFGMGIAHKTADSHRVAVSDKP